MSVGDLEAGVQMGDFQLIRRLGSGGMGVVYLARQKSLDRLVALKVLGPSLSRPVDLARFQREAQAAARLAHPAIARVFFVGQDARVCYLAMEYIEGISLRKAIELLRSNRTAGAKLREFATTETDEAFAPTLRFDMPVSSVAAPDSPPAATPDDSVMSVEAQRVIRSRDHLHQSCQIIRDACRALAYAHSQGVVHRDLKPDNLMLDRQGEVHLIDFGVARFFDDKSLTCTGQIVGTPMYMSPEQVTGRITLDHRTDVYSMGLVLAELLTLETPIVAPSREAVLRQIVTKPLPPIAWRNPAIPKSLSSIVHKATSKDIDERYQSAGDFADDLDRFLTGKPVTARAYRYRLDDSDIVIGRPASVVMAAFIYLILGTLGVLVFGLSSIWGARNARYPEPLFVFYFGQGGLAILVGVLLLQGRTVGWWSGVLVSFFWLCHATCSSAFTLMPGWFFGTTAFFELHPWPSVWLGREEAGAVGGLSATDIGRIVPFALQFSVALLIAAVLLRNTARAWFSLATTIRQEHRRLLGETRV